MVQFIYDEFDVVIGLSTVARALRQAQISLKKVKSHPKYLSRTV